jgi:hypothetical protein
MLFILVFPRIYLVSLFLTMVGVSFPGASFVLLNSFIPIFVANHPSIRDEANADAMPHNSALSKDPNSPTEDDIGEKCLLHNDLPSNSLLNGQPRGYTPLYSDKVLRT